jgi:peptidoglycan/LPS O-acetylase OafA/YrhL
VAQSKSHVLGLDILRCLAALMVAVFHLSYWSWAPAESLTRSVAGGGIAFPAIAPVSSLGWVGVEIFFVISGYVISYSAENASAVSFLVRRVLRLYPAAWICATATLVAVIALGRADAGTAMEYLRTMGLSIMGPWIDGVYWTLGIEICFYALIFLVLIVAGSRLVPLALVAVSLASAAFWGCLAFDRMAPGLLPLRDVHLLLDSPLAAFLLLRHGCFFGLGGLLWLSFAERPSRWRMLVMAIALLTGCIEIADSAREILAPVGAGAAHRGAACLLWLAAVGAIWLSIAGQARLSRWLARWARPITAAGLMTYPCYLLHDVIGAGLMRTAHEAGLPPVAALLLALALVVALSLAVSELLEPPLRAALRRVLTGNVAGGRLAPRPPARQPRLAPEQQAQRQ